MSAGTVKIPRLVTLCGECRKTLRSNHRYVGEDEQLAAYCEHNHAGALFLPALGEWCVFAPLPLERFEAILDNNVRRPRPDWALIRHPLEEIAPEGQA